MNHPYSWSFGESENVDELDDEQYVNENLPEELQELETVQFEGHTIQFGLYDGDLYGAFDYSEFQMSFPVARLGCDVPADEFDITGLDEDAAELVKRWYMAMNAAEQAEAAS